MAKYKVRHEKLYFIFDDDLKILEAHRPLCFHCLERERKNLNYHVVRADRRYKYVMGDIEYWLCDKHEDSELVFVYSENGLLVGGVEKG